MDNSKPTLKQSPYFWFVLSLVCLGGAAYFWRLGDQWKQAEKPAAVAAPTNRAMIVIAPPAKPALVPVRKNRNQAGAKSHQVAETKVPYRVSNTTNAYAQLLRSEKAVLLANAAIDTGKPLDLAIPDRLRAPKNSGTYIVQANWPVDNQGFLEMLRGANAAFVAYIPNNAYLVRVSETDLPQISGNPQTQSVLPFEPYYKLDSTLLKADMEQQPLPANSGLNIVAFADAHDSTVAALKNLGVDVLSEDRSPFGPLLRVNPAGVSIDQIAGLPGVEAVALARMRRPANDLMRPRLGVSPDSTSAANLDYLGLTGTNVLININDSGVDSTHPDLAGRLFADFPSSLIDDNGHGTHVAGTILGTGLESSTVTPTPQGSVKNASFRGMAPNATAYVVGIGMSFRPPQPEVPAYDGASPSDSYLQTQAARTNALISNNSWNYRGDFDYDIAAASYDAAVRDADPFTTGPQPVLFVFAAGDNGGGSDDGTGGFSDSIQSPATSKNGLTVGAVEQPRALTNQVIIDGITNQAMAGITDSDSQVAAFSGCGNVGLGVEGPNGRFKPDVVAPGVFVISTRSSTWDIAGYYNPTNYDFFSYDGLEVNTNSLTIGNFSVPANFIEIILWVSPNSQSPSPLPPIPVYARVNDYPQLTDTPVGTLTNNLGTNNFVLFPTNGLSLNPGDTLFFGLGDSTNKSFTFDLNVEILSTNDVGNYILVYSNMNNALGTPAPNGFPYYRYESGTSMAAAGVSGMLACMQELFQGRLHLTNSPALMKALVINGARAVSPMYDLNPDGGFSPQGWGLASLTNSIPGPLTNYNPASPSSQPLMFFDQNPTNALATGQSQTRKFGLSSAGAGQDLHITLVWTDPPGSPIAGPKLVNNLLLIVTNTDNGQVFYGNDIPSGSTYTQVTDTNNAPNLDLINNVQNVFIQGATLTNFTVTVFAQRVNVNSITSNTNSVVQDYALVVSSGNGGAAPAVPSPFARFTDAPNVSTNFLGTNINFLSLAVLTNGLPLFGQRVAANPTAQATTNGLAGTNGVPAQWNFYVYTNTAAATNGSFTNVAFITWSPIELASPRMGAFAHIPPQSTNASRFSQTALSGADIDLYVSANPALTNLDTNVLNSPLTAKSLLQGGYEAVFFTNSTANQVYYIGVKSEDQQAAEFEIVGLASNLPFSQQNSNGDVTINMMPLPCIIPGGSPTQPGTNYMFGIATQPISIRKVIVTNTISCMDFGDYLGFVTSGQNLAVLNNHSVFSNLLDITETLVYDDSGDGSIPGARHSDGPGTLQSFVGQKSGSGAWIFTMGNDSSQSDTGAVQNLSILLAANPPTGQWFRVTLPPQSWYYGFVDVPPLATNLTFLVGENSTDTGPVDLYVRQGDYPTQIIYDQTEIVLPGETNALSINFFSVPPLSPVRYFYGLYNPNLFAVTVDVFIRIDLNQGAVPETWLLSTDTPIPLPDDAVTSSQIYVPQTEAVAGIAAGIRIQHQRESDLVVTLISPDGTRVLLAENRGQLDTNGYGSGFNITNVFPQTQSGSAITESNVLNLTTNTGTLIMSYQFFTVPDDMQIFYDNVLIHDTGLISGAGQFTLDFGPGISTNLVIVMNAPGTNPNTNDSTDLWNYTATIIEQNLAYARFSDDTNKSLVPIKFAPPPFGTNVTGYGSIFSDFEVDGLGASVGAGNYIKGTVLDGWTINSNLVTVITTPPPAHSGTNFLALRDGSIVRTIPNTVPGVNYSVQFSEERALPLDPVHWWTGNSNTLDVMGISPQPAYWLPLGSDSYSPAEVNAGFLFAANTNNYLEVVANPALNIGVAQGFTVDAWIKPTSLAFNQPLVEWFDADGVTAGLSLWLITNATGNGVLCGNIVDLAGTNHQILTASPAISGPGVFHHVALTYSRTTNTAALYVDGVQVALDNTITNVVAQTSPAYDLYFGAQISTGDRFVGILDEIGLYSQTLSTAQILDLYLASNLGRCGSLNPPSICPTPMANVLLNGATVSTVVATATNWSSVPFTFTATGTTTTLEIDASNNTSGVQLDTFTLTAPGQNNYYLPEEPLAKLLGQNPQGNWTLQILDNRAGATNPAPQLLSWELSFTFNNTTPAPRPLLDAVAATNFVAPGGIAYYSVTVPSWAIYATNFLANVTGGSVNLLFNQSFLPTTNTFNYNLLNNVNSGGSVTLTTNGTPPLLPGQTYFLGVQNTGNTTVSFDIVVDFNLISLFNGVTRFNESLAPSIVPQYYQYIVTNTNAVALSFQVLNPTGNLTLVANYGGPLPDTAVGDYNYISANPGTNLQSIVVTTNSRPAPLALGVWYVGVFNTDTSTVNYAIVANETDATNQPVIIMLTNGVPFTTNAAPGVALNTFYQFNVSNTPPAVLFEVYKMNNNVDLTLDFGVLPYNAPFFDGSFNPGLMPEQIVLQTNLLGTNINGSWFLGVPNNSLGNASYTIYAAVSLTNGLLVSPLPLSLGVTLPNGGGTNGVTLSWQSVIGQTYDVLSTTALTPPITWVTNAVITATGTITSYTDTNSVASSTKRYYEVIQVP